MAITTGRTAILHRNDFLERFLTYNTVFQEFFKTMDLIDRGEALKYETYDRLINNFLLNLKIYGVHCSSFLEKEQLTNTLFEEKLNLYFIELVESLKCLDTKNNQLDRSKMQLAQQKISDSGRAFVQIIDHNIS
ncbi:hypothetical protein [Companilactobacillus furfuricola]|uniref:hypothetical protein n=1 Tax=Companilactobacillus furfuricola TaxID=1462575 RepID=UPI000F7722A4|nr:hypothetical protein [Companilactobacillus furfuricola]